MVATEGNSARPHNNVDSEMKKWPDFDSDLASVSLPSSCKIDNHNLLNAALSREAPAAKIICPFRTR